MKKLSLLAASLIGLALAFSACKGGEGVKILKRGEGTVKAQKGDIVVGEMWIMAGDSVLMAYAGKPEPIFQVNEPEFKGDLSECLTQLCEGDSARIIINADSLRVRGAQLPEIIKDKLTYIVKIHKLYTQEGYQEYLREKAAEADQKQQEAIAAYLQEKNLTAAPLESGLYLILTKENKKGKAIAQGATIKFNYVGRLLNGTIFDTNLEEVAKENNMLQEGRPYEPLQIPAGVGQMIPGVDEALIKMKVGEKATLIIPFQLAYGDRDLGQIPPYSTLVFELEIVSAE